MADNDDRITIEISQTNRYLRLWMATWSTGGTSGSTHPLPRHLLAEQVTKLIEERLEANDRAQEAAETQDKSASHGRRSTATAEE